MSNVELSDHDALTRHFDRFRGPVIGLVASWGPPWGEAIEIAQDAFAKAYLSRERCYADWKEPEVFGPWVRGFARNEFRNWKKRAARSARVVPLESAPEPGTLEEAEPEHVEALRAAIRQLPVKHREVVLMRYYDDASLADIAALVGTSVRGIEGRLHQARKKLARALERRGTPRAATIGVLACL